MVNQARHCGWQTNDYEIQTIDIYLDFEEM